MRRSNDPAKRHFLTVYENILSERRIGIIVIDESAAILKVNQVCCEIFGFDEKDIVGQPFNSVFNAEFDQHLSGAPSGEDGKREIRFVHPSGRTEWLKSSIHTFPPYTCYEVQRVNCPSNQTSYRHMLNKQQGMTFTYKKIDGRFIHTFNDGELMYRFGFKPADIVGKELKEFLGEKSALRKEPFYERAWSGEEQVQYEETIGDITYLASLQPIKDDRGNVIEVIATCVEITERTRMEEALREAETKYRTLVEEAIIGICMIQDGIITYANPILTQMFGYSSEEFTGKTPNHFVIPEDMPLLEINIAKIYRQEYGPPIHIKGIRKDGRLIDLEVCGSVTTLNDRPAVLGMVMDITEKRLTQEMLQKSEKLSVIGQLAAGIAHEIRNPLTSLKGFVQLIKRDDQTNPYYDIMLSELERINTIVNELLIVAKPQAYHYRNNDVVAIIHDVTILLQSQASLNNVEIRVNNTEKTAIVECEGNQIKQMFINIIKNAIEAMPDGGNLTVHINAMQADKVVVHIQDEGGGIPEDRVARLGEPFYSTKDKGTGLGLMMCYKIIQEHHGQIRVESEMGKGTTVEATLLKRMP